MRGCLACRGLGSHTVQMSDVRREYRKARKLYYERCGTTPSDVDDQVKRRVERAQFLGVNRPSIWFDAIFFMLRDLGMLEEYWTLPEK